MLLYKYEWKSKQGCMRQRRGTSTNYILVLEFLVLVVLGLGRK